MKNNEILLELCIVAKPECLKSLRDSVKSISATVGVPAKVQHELALAVDEACSNIIKHAYHFAADKQIEIKIAKADNALIFRLHDDGEAVDESMLVPRNLGQIRPGGLGLHFIHKIMDEAAFVDLDSAGNTLEMVKYI